MPDLNATIQDGIYYQIKRVLLLMGEDRIDAGLSAFEDGSSNWSECFFARAFKKEFDLASSSDPERVMCKALDLWTNHPIPRPNRVPLRIIWHTFDQVNGSRMSKSDLYKLIASIRDETRPQEVLDILAGIDYTGVSEKEIVLACR